MSTSVRLKISTVVVLQTVFLFSACKSTETENQDRTPRRVSEMDAPAGRVAPGLQSSVDEVKTVQLYRGNDESALPILSVSNREPLNLEFDIIAQQGRPLSVYFYHADKDWQRDLSPAEFLDSFQRDDILDYTPSRGTEVNYVHYRYRFPNESIRFTVSGNYIVRVTEQGDEQRTIFERPFFVSEQQTNVELILDSTIMSGFTAPAIQPFALFTPPQSTQANVFNYSVCFARNGAFGESRCTDQPSLMNQPALEFYLRPSSVFEPVAASYFLDLSRLQHGNQIERIDMTASPFQVALEPDLGRLGSSGLGPQLNGQVLVSQAVTDVAQPDLSAQYINVTFRLTPEGSVRYSGDIFVIGGFNNWNPGPSARMTWNAAEGRYEGTVLIKQGQYDYRYVSSSTAVTRRLQRGLPRQDNLYTAFVYYEDITLQTDRLISVGGTTR